MIRKYRSYKHNVKCIPLCGLRGIMSDGQSDEGSDDIVGNMAEKTIDNIFRTVLECMLDKKRAYDQNSG